jgi:hypothetical protein
MGSSGGGGGNPQALYGQSAPMPGIPVAGKDSTIGDPFNYGQFQNFLPDVKETGENDMATGLRPDMFKYKHPDGTSPDMSTGGNSDQDLRDALAKLLGNQPAQPGGIDNRDGAPAGTNIGIGAGPGFGGVPAGMGMGGAGGGAGAGGPQFGGTAGKGKGVYDFGPSSGKDVGNGMINNLVSGGGGYQGNMDPTGGQFSQGGSAGFTAFSPWGGGQDANNPEFRRGAQQGPIDWRAKDAEAAAAAAAAAAAQQKPPGT